MQVGGTDSRPGRRHRAGRVPPPADHDPRGITRMPLMTKITRTGRTPLTVVAAVTGTLLVSGGAYATASTLVTGKDVQDNSITTKDIRNHSLTARDFKKGTIKRGKQGLQGATGTTGATGETGATGATGETG